jgi:hypothetical protein
MRRIDVEEWAFRILERVAAAQSTEDSLVELKSTWPPVREIARQLAAHANSAAAQPIMWLMGVDQKIGVVPFHAQDAARWRDQLGKEFDGFAPLFTHYDLDWRGQPFSALVFETDAAPFVVLNPNRGQPNSGPFDREVPWREGRTRSASRAEVIRIARPSARLPIVEVIAGRVTVTDRVTASFHNWAVELSLYGVSETLGRMFLPFFGLRAHIATSAGEEIPLDRPTVNANSEDPHVVYIRDQQIVIDGAGRFGFYGVARTETLSQQISEPLTVNIRLKVAGNDLPLVITCRLKPSADRAQFMAVWST